MRKYYPGGKDTDVFIAAGCNFAQPLIYPLKQCGDDYHRIADQRVTGFELRL